MWNKEYLIILKSKLFIFTQLIPSTSFSRKLSPVMLVVVLFRTSQMGNFVESYNS